jgi:hypothetical protein
VSDAEEICVRPIPNEMSTPPYGATFTMHEDHGTVELPYWPEVITVLPGECVRIAIADRDGQLKLLVTRERGEIK